MTITEDFADITYNQPKKPMTKQEHPQADILVAIASEGMKKDIVQLIIGGGGSWCNITSSYALELISQGRGSELRVKPKTIRIGSYDVAEPMRVAPEDETEYFRVMAGATNDVERDVWYGVSHEIDALGMCWLKREDAELAAKAIRELLAGSAT